MKLLFSNKKKEIIYLTTPPFTPFLGILFKKLFKQRYHLIVWDLYPQALLAGKLKAPNKFIYQLWDRANHPLFKHASTVTTIGHSMAVEISRYSNSVPPKIISNWIDNTFIVPIAKAENAFAKKYKQVGKLTVMYSGNMGSTHDFDSILKVADLLKDNQNINFIFIGDGIRKAEIENNVMNRHLSNVIILPLQDYKDIPLSIGAADIGIITLDKSVGHASVPSKTYSFLAAGSALLALGPENSEVARMIKKYKCGRMFRNDDVEGIMQFILLASLNKEMLLQMQVNARDASEDFTPANAKEYFQHIA